jgi:hypothetical protein
MAAWQAMDLESKMPAARGEAVKRPHPAVTAAILLVLGAVLSLFPIALYANVMAMADGYRAAHGEAGMPGTATVESVVEGRGGQVCRGMVALDDGTVAADVQIDVPGGCEEGQVAEVRLMEGRSSMFIGYDEPRAWAAGSLDWAVYVPLVVLFGLLSLLPALLVVVILAELAKLVFLPREAPEV